MDVGADAEVLAALEGEVRALQISYERQADTVRALKADKKEGRAVAADVDAAVKELAAIRLSREEKVTEYQKLSGVASEADEAAFKERVNSALTRRLFFMPAFKIYNGIGGLYDYGPPGSAAKTNLIAAWRRHFVHEESMLEIECRAVTPECVLKASGHVEKFSDYMVRDMVTKDCIRADHLLKEVLEPQAKDPLTDPAVREEIKDVLARVDEFDEVELGKMLRKYGCKAPDTGNDVSDPFPFNLMFETQIGPAGNNRGFLRPETAQGIFVNFRDLLYYNGLKLPFAAAQVGQAFRNEISPQAGLLRVREFTLAEIEHFVAPDNKDHPRFDEVKHVPIRMFGRDEQLSKARAPVTMTVGDAVAAGRIDNQTLGYFIARVHLFLMKVGIIPDKLRFRQHLQHEMAHYATDCWDAEIQSSYGWIECVGIADRSAYDLQAHMTASKVDLTAYEKYDEPRMEEKVVVTPNAKVMGKEFKKNAQLVKEKLMSLSEEDALALKADLEGPDASASVSLCTTGEAFKIVPEMVTIERVTKKESGRTFVPGVIEPSFGIGRILYSIFEHAFSCRSDDEAKVFFKFVPEIAPTKCTIFPLIPKGPILERTRALQKELSAAGLSTLMDTTGASIGKRYARTDEIGVPFACTVDPKSLEDDTATLRERDSMRQVRMSMSELPKVVSKLVEGSLTWEAVETKYEKVSAE